MATLAEQASASGAPPAEVAEAAVKDAVAAADTDAEKEALAERLYKEATGRFPQKSSDRKAVYLGALVLLGFVFLVFSALVAYLLFDDKKLPDSVAVLATAILSGIVGGLFGYAQQN